MLRLKLDEQLEKEVETIALQMGISESELVRLSLTEFIKKHRKPSAWELGSELFGKYDSGKGNLSTHRKVLLKTKIE